MWYLVVFTENRLNASILNREVLPVAAEAGDIEGRMAKTITEDLYQTIVRILQNMSVTSL